MHNCQIRVLEIASGILLPIPAPSTPNKKARSLLPRGPWFVRTPKAVSLPMANNSVLILSTIRRLIWRWLPSRLLAGGSLSDKLLSETCDSLLAT